MGKRIKIYALIHFALVFVLSVNTWAENAPSSCEDAFSMETEVQSLQEQRRLQEEEVVQVRSRFWQASDRPSGLNKATLERDLPNTSQLLQTWNERFANHVRYAKTLSHIGLVARALKEHMLLLGGWGGGKTRFADAFIGSEGFRLLMTPMTEVDQILGARDFEAAKRGRHIVRVQDSMLSHRVALLDEVGNANSSTLGALHNALGVERELRIGSTTFPVNTETVFATSNDFLSELMTRFRLEGNEKAGLAFANRILFKTYFLNWIPEEEQAALDMLREAQDSGTVLSSKGSELPTLNFIELKTLAEGLIRISPEYRSTEREFLKRFRKGIQELRTQQETSGRSTHPYIPTADLTERLRGMLAPMVRLSAFLDLLNTPKALSKLQPGQMLTLEPLSLWRLHLALTTNTSGTTSLNKNVSNPIGYEVTFADLPDPNNGFEELAFYSIESERAIFNTALRETLSSIQSAVSQRAQMVSRIPILPSAKPGLTGIEQLLLDNR